MLARGEVAHGQVTVRGCVTIVRVHVGLVESRHHMNILSIVLLEQIESVADLVLLLQALLPLLAHTHF